MFKIYLSFCHDNKKSNKWSYFLALKYIKVQIPYFSMRQNKYYVIGAKRKFRHSTERRSTDIQIRLNFNNNARLLSLCYRWRIWRNSNQIINQESLQRKRSCFNLYVFIKKYHYDKKNKRLWFYWHFNISGLIGSVIQGV